MNKLINEMNNKNRDEIYLKLKKILYMTMSIKGYKN